MTERLSGEWNIDKAAIGDALGSPPEAIHDRDHGRGHRYTFPDDTAIDVFSAKRVARARLPIGAMEFHGFAQPRVSAEHGAVVFPHTKRAAALVMRPGGGVDFIYDPKGHEIAPEERIESSGRSGQHRDEAALTDDQAARGDPLGEDLADVIDLTDRLPQQARTGEGSGAPAQERGERVTISGRLGREPSFRQTRTGLLVGRFPLAERVGEDQTVWHRIVAFSGLAADLQDKAREGKLRKGKEISVVGYEHATEKERADGSTTTVTDIYAALVKGADWMVRTTRR